MKQKCEVYELRTANSIQAQIQDYMDDNWIVESITPVYSNNTTYVIVCYTLIA